MGENYIGVKYQFERIEESYPPDKRLPELNYWAYLFSELGLAPAHPKGAYGNHSMRCQGNSFIITKTGMKPAREVNTSSYCLVSGFPAKNSTLPFRGKFPPSSEALLHFQIYKNLKQVNAILHGHSNLLLEKARELNIPTTEHFYEYGTPELAESALKMAMEGYSFFILKKHGFVATGASLQAAGKESLEQYRRLITLLLSN